MFYSDSRHPGLFYSIRGIGYEFEKEYVLNHGKAVLYSRGHLCTDAFDTASGYGGMRTFWWDCREVPAHLAKGDE